MAFNTPKITKEQVLQLPKLLESMTIVDIAEEWKCHANTIRYWVGQLKKRGIECEIRHRGKLSILDY